MQMDNEIKPGRISFYYFGETGNYDEYSPVFVCGKNYVPEIVHLIASGQPNTLSQVDISGRLNISGEQVEEAIIGLIRIGAIEESGHAYKLCFPVFLEQDMALINGYLSHAGETIGQVILSLKGVLHKKIERLECRKDFAPERIFYHLICDETFDGAAFDFFSAQGILCASKVQPDNRDYLIVGFEESYGVNTYSSGLLCSSNNFRSGSFNFNSFGDSNGTRKDMYRFFRSVQKDAEKATPFEQLNQRYIKLLKNPNIDLARKCGELILSLSSQTVSKEELEDYDRDIASFLKDLGYLDLDETGGKMRSNVPVFKNTDQTVIDEVSALVLAGIFPRVRSALDSIEKQFPGITPTRHQVNFKEVANELWHQLFGRANEYLARTGFVAMPNNIEGEGRYLRSLWICDE